MSTNAATSEAGDSDTEMFLPTSAPRSGHQISINGRRRTAKKRRYIKIVLLSVLVVSAIVILFEFMSVPSSTTTVNESFSKISNPDYVENYDYPPLTLPALSPEEYGRLCYPDLLDQFSIADVDKKIKSLLNADPEPCQILAKTFSRIYSINKVDGEIRMPKEFIPEVKSWLNYSETLFASMQSQDIYQVNNRIWGEASVFNMLRSKRPVSKPSADPKVYVEELAKTTQPTCDFCRYKEHTAEDVFGRVTSTFSASASNTFKLAKFHGLFFPLDHHPLNIPLSVLEDLFLQTAQLWIKKAQEVDPSQKFATLLWDTLPHAGASQIHPHVHGLLDTAQYAGQFGQLQQGTREYFQKYKQNLWSDVLLIHWALGLVVNQGEAVALIPITARKDHEYMILSDKLNKDVIKLLWLILQGYRNDLGIYCFSSGGALPPLTADTPGLPVIYRIGSRGDCTSVRSDVSSLELYTVNNINSDLAATLKALLNAKAAS